MNNDQSNSTPNLNMKSTGSLPPIKLKHPPTRSFVNRTQTPKIQTSQATIDPNPYVENVTNYQFCFPYLHKVLGKDEKTKFFKQKSAELFGKDQNTIQGIKHLMSQYIAKNRKFVNVDVVKIPDYEKKAVININQLEFMDKLMKDVKIVNKNYGFNEDNLQRNLLGLERVVLERIIKLEQTVQKEQKMKKNFAVPNI